MSLGTGKWRPLWQTKITHFSEIGTKAQSKTLGQPMSCFNHRGGTGLELYFRLLRREIAWPQTWLLLSLQLCQEPWSGVHLHGADCQSCVFGELEPDTLSEFHEVTRQSAITSPICAYSIIGNFAPDTGQADLALAVTRPKAQVPGLKRRLC